MTPRSAVEVIFSELPRSHTYDRFERPRKVALVIISHAETYLRAVFIRRQKHLFGMTDPDIRQVIDQGDSHLFLE